MNIIMNVNGVKFGTELEEFRNKTKLLPPPRRGYALDTCDFIRTIHNSVARYVPFCKESSPPLSNPIPYSRTDLLNEDLLLDNKSTDNSKKRTKTPPKKKARTSKSGRLAFKPESFHYIAFVPVDGEVWELDGLESMPLCLGTFP